MKPFREFYPSERMDEALLINNDVGIAWQADIQPYDYADDYWQNYVEREHTPIARKLNEFRCWLAEKYCKSVLDVGIGCGEFLKKLRIKGLGYDVNAVAIKWLVERDIFADPYVDWPNVDGMTLWDVLEHIEDPHKLISVVPVNRCVIVSIPVFDDLSRVRTSKHYKPNEHLFYVTKRGMEKWFGDIGFELHEYRLDETAIGREGIGTFVFYRSGFHRE